MRDDRSTPLATFADAETMRAMQTTSSDASSFDVVVLGGALSGAATATLLLRHNARACEHAERAFPGRRLHVA